MRFWKLTIIKVLVGFIGGFIVCFLLVKPTIHKAIDKETTKNEIAIRKIKKPQDLSVVLSPECIPKPINDNDCVDISSLSDSRKKRVYRWLEN